MNSGGQSQIPASQTPPLLQTTFSHKSIIIGGSSLQANSEKISKKEKR
jgi:hypothetical protein